MGHDYSSPGARLLIAQGHKSKRGRCDLDWGQLILAVSLGIVYSSCVYLWIILCVRAVRASESCSSRDINSPLCHSRCALTSQHGRRPTRSAAACPVRNKTVRYVYCLKQVQSLHIFRRKYANEPETAAKQFQQYGLRRINQCVEIYTGLQLYHANTAIDRGRTERISLTHDFDLDL